MFGMKKTELRLLPHDPTWKNDFTAEKNRIISTLQNPSIQIEHIGSTSIPTVHAKPILDIAILCNQTTFEPLVQTLIELGYDYRGKYDEGNTHFYAVLEKDKIRYCQAHIYTEPDSDFYCKLHFRNVLSQNLELAREYDEYKLSLAKTVSNKSEYAEIKSRWVDKFIVKVMEVEIDE